MRWQFVDRIRGYTDLVFIGSFLFCPRDYDIDRVDFVSKYLHAGAHHRVVVAILGSIFHFGPERQGCTVGGSCLEARLLSEQGLHPLRCFSCLPRRPVRLDSA